MAVDISVELKAAVCWAEMIWDAPVTAEFDVSDTPTSHDTSPLEKQKNQTKCNSYFKDVCLLPSFSVQSLNYRLCKHQLIGFQVVRFYSIWSRGSISDKGIILLLCKTIIKIWAYIFYWCGFHTTYFLAKPDPVKIIFCTTYRTKQLTQWRLVAGSQIQLILVHHLRTLKE